ncbi:MAG: hypothetical protein EOP83_02135 [Verrucomicrobiaceae bacterium]|nr:MAG: hypothetical protein EOP83_02135 [Verrucomicrobiaceae bacterium]
MAVQLILKPSVVTDRIWVHVRQTAGSIRNSNISGSEPVMEAVMDYCREQWGEPGPRENGHLWEMSGAALLVTTMTQAMALKMRFEGVREESA